MRRISKRLDNNARLRVADYYAELPPPAREGPAIGTGGATEGNSAAASLYHLGDEARDIPACGSCHGPEGGGVGEGNPALAGQPTPYLAEQLRKWREGERHGNAGGMLHISRALAADEVTALADYISRLPGAKHRQGLPETSPPEHRRDPRSGA